MNHFRTWNPATRATILALSIASATAFVAGCGGDDGTPSTRFERTNLVSDVSGVAPVTDPNLVNAWGVAFAPTGPFWINDNGTSVSTLYNGAGTPFPPPPDGPLVVHVPGPDDGDSSPTGIVFNGTSDFVVTEGDKSGPAAFIFDTEDGTISGWNPTVNANNAILEVDDSDEGAVYKGLAIGVAGGANYIYVTNFSEGLVEPYDKDFEEVELPGDFTDPNLPEGFSPFGIQNIGGVLYVTYAKPDEDGEDDVKGPGNGYVNVFDTSGQFIRRVASAGALNSPWGLAIAPQSFGTFAGSLLVGNFGDGRINAYNSQTGAFVGTIADSSGDAITVDGLWGLIVGNGTLGGDANFVYFTAGPVLEQHGLFGFISAVGS